MRCTGDRTQLDPHQSFALTHHVVTTAPHRASTAAVEWNSTDRFKSKDRQSDPSRPARTSLPPSAHVSPAIMLCMHREKWRAQPASVWMVLAQLRHTLSPCLRPALKPCCSVMASQPCQPARRIHREMWLAQPALAWLVPAQSRHPLLPCWRPALKPCCSDIAPPSAPGLSRGSASTSRPTLSWPQTDVTLHLAPLLNVWVLCHQLPRSPVDCLGPLLIA